MSSAAEVAYQAGLRGLNGQAEDLASIRSRVGAIVTAGGIAAAFLGGTGESRGFGPFYWLALAMFGMLSLATIVTYWGVDFRYDNDGYDLVNNFVDAGMSADMMMRELAVHAEDDYRQNRAALDNLFKVQAIALVAFGVEVLGLMVDLAQR